MRPPAGPTAQLEQAQLRELRARVARNSVSGARFSLAWTLLGVAAMAVAAVFDTDKQTASPLRFGAFQVTDRIAEGGTAFIFRGRHLETGETVALKTVRTGVAHEVAVLTREIATLRDLRHPGIVRFVTDGVRDSGLPWMAVELLEGRTLFEEMGHLWWEAGERSRTAAGRTQRTDFARANGGWIFSLKDDPALAVPTRQPAAGRLWDALAVLLRLCPALTYIHGRGVVHGDLKPANVLLGSDGRVTLVDFGVAQRPRRWRGDPEANRVRMGTTEYAAPELISGERIDAAADIYSLGCMLYELITGRLPFEGGSAEDIARQHMSATPLPPSELVSGLSWELEDLITEMLAKKPARRPHSARHVAGRLARLMLRAPQQ